MGDEVTHLSYLPTVSRTLQRNMAEVTNEVAKPPSSPTSATEMKFGGDRSQDSFCLLDGFDDTTRERVTIDITRIPAVLGRSNEADKNNPYHFSLGTKKAFSRRHISIYYRDKEGGRVVWDEETQTTVYKDAKTIAKEEGPQSLPKSNSKFGNQGLSANGFFVIESLGKNRILVDKKILYQGESMVLHSGSSIRISNYLYVFLLPQDAEPKPHVIDLGESAPKKKSTKKKRPAPVPSSPVAKKKATTSASTLAELETLPVEELLEKMDEAVSKGLWDRKNQVIGASICLHAVRAAGMAPEIQEKVLEDGGVSRSDIMEWIQESEKFGGWVQQMLTNMEPRSYQAAITKSLLKSGFVRTSGAGRYIKWELPKDIPLSKKKTTKPSAPQEEDGSENNPQEEEDEDEQEEPQEEDEGLSQEGEEKADEDNDEENDGDDNDEQEPEENVEEEEGLESDMDIVV